MEIEVKYESLVEKESDDFEIIDIREAKEYASGHLAGAINIPKSSVVEKVKDFSKTKEIYIYCENDGESLDIAEQLRKEGFEAFSLSGGYAGWLQKAISGEESKEKATSVERSIRKKFHGALFSKFCKAITEYELVKPNDKIAVCISGGKDSMLMAKLFQELQMHRKIPFELVFLVMDPGYSKANREKLEKNAHMLNIPITIFEANIFENVFNIEKSPCYICARMRRGYLYSKAKELGCNKIALGHHYDDVIETILMGMLYGGQVQTMMPKLHSTNFEGMQLIRPMYLIREEDIKHWCKYNELHFIQCACRFTEAHYSETAQNNTGSKRKMVKNLIAELKQETPQIEGNIFRSVENVNLSTIISYKDKDNICHHFLEDYDD